MSSVPDFLASAAKSRTLRRFALKSPSTHEIWAAATFIRLVVGRFCQTPTKKADDDHRKFLSSAPILRISGQRHAAPTTTRTVPIPPATTEITGPKSAAVNPDSNPP